ncbi:MAG: ABC transporter substrate-binding protein [Caulobacteraceae bacterium]|nr:ABC transporter substrate-binding protein [Caulobacteraceae bacterium]
MTLEKTQVRLGFIALSDCAPLAVAEARGLFAAEGLEVTLSREPSWANVRDRLAAGLLDGAHMLAPMAVAQSLGLGGEGTPMRVPLALNLNGSAITVSRAVAAALRAIDPDGMARRPRSASSLRRLIEQRRRHRAGPLTFAVVFPYSIHNYELRYWLAAGGVDPDRDVRLIIVPPARMVEKLSSGEIDGFCVGAPWNGLAAQRGLGEILLHAAEWWGAGPDKVFGVTRAWAEAHPETLRALVRALLRAAAWADDANNRPELAALLARPEYVGAPEAALRLSLLGGAELGADGADYLVFHRYAASFPWRSHAAWFLSQMIRWGQAPRDADFAAAAEVYDPSLLRAAAADLGLAAPLIDAKPEGAHAAPWRLAEATAPIAMAADSFVDGKVFDPADPLAYLDAFADT